MRRHKPLLGVALLLGVLSAPLTASAGTVSLPPTSGAFDYQLGGSYRPSAGTTIVERDATAKPVAGVYSVCYVNGFQTQQVERTWWRAHPSLLLTTKADRLATDPNWPGEYILDTSTSAKRHRIAARVGRTLSRCAARGFDAVEVDNLDTFTRFSALSRSGNLALAALYARHAHADGLAIAQKNAAQASRAAKRVAAFDFAISEECVYYRECGSYARTYGARVYDVEYTDALRSSVAAVCRSDARPALTVVRDRDLLARGNAGYRLTQCAS